MKDFTHKFIKLFLMISGIFLLWSPLCAVAASTTQTAVIVTAGVNSSTGYYTNSGAVSLVSVDPVGGPRTFANLVDPVTTSDLSIASYGKYFYVIGRYGIDNVTKYDITAPDKMIWQYSTDSTTGENSNPQDLIFLNDTRSYLTRLGSAKVWIVNPSTNTNQGFKVGAIDLSSPAYVDTGITDGLPKIHSGVIVDGPDGTPFLFVTLEEFNYISTPPYVKYYQAKIAVINTSTETPIGVIAIPASMKDPYEIQYVNSTKMIYVQCNGNTGISGSESASGIVAIDPTAAIDALTKGNTYTPPSAIISGDSTHGFISGMAIISATKGYFVGYVSWGNNTLYSFNPSTGANIQPISGLEHINIGGFECGTTLDQNGMLWICNQTAYAVDILNPSTDKIDETISTKQAPLKVAFADGAPQDISAFNNNSSGGGGCFISASGR